MADERQSQDRRRPRKPTPAERREQRSAVDDPGEVLEAGARFLEARPRSIAEVRRKLTRLGYRQELVTGAVGRLVELGYLDDDAFARAWVESRDRARPRGEHALRRELELRGVDRSIVDAVLEDRRADAGPDEGSGEAGGGSADDRAAERLLRKRLPALLREPDARRRRQRAYALLARSGFAPDVCSAVSARVAGAAGATGDDDLPANDA
jgi:regulatory protein